MNTQRFNVLFVCTANSARSIIAEAVMNHVAGERFIAYSAGSHPRGKVHPLALRVLAANRMSTDGLRSKSWDEFAGPDAPELHFVFTVCDRAAGETCPNWPGQPISANWGLPDPAAVGGDEAHQERAFNDTLIAMTRRIQLLLALPLKGIDRATLQQQMKAIGQTTTA